jgi:hypothetical protein
MSRLIALSLDGLEKSRVATAPSRRLMISGMTVLEKGKGYLRGKA